MADSAETDFRFGAFRYDPAQRLLYRNGELVQLQPKVLELLEILLRRRGEAISRDDLLKALWPDCVVEEIGLARNVSLLRKALGEDADSYVETVPKRGYRFTAAPPPAPKRTSRAWGARMWLFAVLTTLTVGVTTYWQFYRSSRFFPQPVGTPSVAVVPFDRLTSDMDPAFGQPISDALATEISKLGRIQVTSPSTVRRYRRVGVPVALMDRVLGLDAVVEGTAQRFGTKVRISIWMTDAHSGKLIWADAFDLDAGDPGDAELKVAREVASQIAARLAPR